LGHLAPVLVQVSEQLSRTQGGALGLVRFLAQLFDKLLPALEFFSTSQVVIRETTLELGSFSGYVGSVLIYAGLYSAIALLFGLILFEDRDLAWFAASQSGRRDGGGQNRRARAAGFFKIGSVG